MSERRPVCESVSITAGAMSSNWANPPSHSHRPNSLHFWQNYPKAKKKLYLAGSEPGLRYADRRGLVNLWVWLQTLVDQKRAGADVGVRKPNKRILPKTFKLETFRKGPQ